MSEDARPDVVLIHCHDLGRWLPTYGMGSVPAPELTAFAEESIVFENAHAAAPLCSPARGALFTGTTPYRNGVQGLVHNAWRYRDGVLTAPERLRPLGYHSALIGLQHENVDPTVLGFDEVPGQGFLPRANQVVDAASDWLAALDPRGRREPVFLTIGTWEVHRPWPAEDYAPVDPAAVDVPSYLPDNEHTRRDIAAFHGSIAQFDGAFGRLLRTIDETLGRDASLVVFTTDHGAAFPRAKSTLYDAGTGVSFIVRPPAAWGTAPARRPELVSHLDLVPTLLDVAGGETADWLEGRSLLPLLRDGSAADASAVERSEDERLLFTAKSHHDGYDPKRAVRSLDYLYVRNYEPGPKLQLPGDLEKSDTRKGMTDAHLDAREAEELYDRGTDPDELVNVVDDPRYDGTRARYAEALHAWLARTGDPVETERLDDAPARTRHVDDLPSVPSVRRDPTLQAVTAESSRSTDGGSR